MTVQLPDSPQPDEIAVIFCVANRGRIGARVGGPWGKRSDAPGQCWRKLTVNELPPSLACAGSEENVRVCLLPVFFAPQDGRLCLPLSSFDGNGAG